MATTYDNVTGYEEKEIQGGKVHETSLVLQTETAPGRYNLSSDSAQIKCKSSIVVGWKGPCLINIEVYDAVDKKYYTRGRFSVVLGYWNIYDVHMKNVDGVEYEYKNKRHCLRFPDDSYFEYNLHVKEYDEQQNILLQKLQ